jgi:hemerythrin-like metal-binding protein
MALELLSWDESYRVGVEEIDRQHRRLFDLLNSFTRAVTSGHAEEIIGEVLSEMAAYADEHFKCEQLYLERHPDYPSHLLQHWEFTKHCMGLVMGFRRDREVSWDTLSYLSEWLRKHVLTEDRRYFRELTEQGLLD